MIPILGVSSLMVVMLFFFTNTTVTSVSSTSVPIGTAVGNLPANGEPPPVIGPIGPIVGIPAYDACNFTQGSVLFESFEESDPAFSSIQTFRASISRSTSYVTNGQSSLAVTTEATPATESHMDSVTIPESTPLNWSNYGALEFDVTSDPDNSIVEALNLEVRVLGSNGDGPTAHAQLGPGEKRTLIVFFNSIPSSGYGMQSGPGAMTPSSAQSTPLEASKVQQIYFGIGAPAGTPAYTFYLDNLRLIPVANTATSNVYRDLLDEYGQNNCVSYDGKVASNAELNAQAVSEEKNLTSDPQPAGLPKLDLYGGDAAMPLGAKTGFFNTAKDSSGKWWLKDPLGNAFYLVGMNGLDIEGETDTWTDLPNGDGWASDAQSIRSLMFSWLPDTSDPLYGFMGTGCATYSSANSCLSVQPRYTFYGANLTRKYGSSSAYHDWVSTSVKRLKSWGFNTVGNSSDNAFFQGFKSVVPAPFSEPSPLPSANMPFTPRLTSVELLPRS